MQRKKPVATPIAIDGYDLMWTLIRDTQWCSLDDHQGIAISVCKAGPTRREMIMKYPYLGVRPIGNWHSPERPKVTLKIVEDAIRAGIAAGWDPDSRGKPFTFEVPEISE
ncbi:MAG TPA: hypothetical protein VIJ85_11550 [Rhizomicrobium sp.]